MKGEQRRVKRPSTSGPNGRVGIVATARTPFSKMGGQLSTESSVEMAVAASKALIERFDLAGKIESIVMGSVFTSDQVWYLARQVGLALELSDVSAHSSELACGTGARTLVDGAFQILTGESEIVLIGGAESLSSRPVEVSAAARNWIRFERGNAAALRELSMSELLPQDATVIEPYSGRTLLSHCEDMISEFQIARADADSYAAQSHAKALAAQSKGLFDSQIVPMTTRDGVVVSADTLIRTPESLSALAELKPIEAGGTITAGNASPLTDGASVVLLASERAMEECGLAPTGFLKSWAFTSHAPSVGALFGTALALDVALHRAELTLTDIDLVELHEAFAGQILANLRALKSESFAAEHFVAKEPRLDLDPTLLNVNGGSLALGHPFGATGGRLVGQALDELNRRRGSYAALSMCAGGSRGAALILERAQ